jgi:hypothetical protein
MPQTSPLLDHDAVTGRMRKHQVRRLANGVENALLEHVEAECKSRLPRDGATSARFDHPSHPATCLRELANQISP